MAVRHGHHPGEQSVAKTWPKVGCRGCVAVLRCVVTDEVVVKEGRLQ